MRQQTVRVHLLADQQAIGKDGERAVKGRHEHHNAALKVQVRDVEVSQNPVEMIHMVFEPFLVFLFAHLSQFLGKTVQTRGQVAAVDRVGRYDVAEKEIEVGDAQDAEEGGWEYREKDDPLVYALPER